MKSTSKLIVVFSAIVLLFSGCEDAAKYIPKNTGLTDEEIIQGLKEALNVSTDTTVNLVTKVNGYFADQAIKLLLPPQAASVINNLKSLDGGMTIYNNTLKPLEDDLILALNRAAEDAATTATPIFKKAITDITITDGMNILKGTDTAATNYLRVKTFNSLVSAYAPKIDVSLGKPLVGGYSANYYWNAFVTGYNNVVDIQNAIPFNAGLDLIKITDTSLGVYATDKALKGLFLKVGEEEREIRKNPLDRVTDILQKVFGSLDN